MGVGYPLDLVVGRNKNYRSAPKHSQPYAHVDQKRSYYFWSYIAVCSALGADMYDCVYPSRTARFGTALVPEVCRDSN